MLVSWQIGANHCFLLACFYLNSHSLCFSFWNNRAHVQCSCSQLTKWQRKEKIFLYSRFFECQNFWFAVPTNDTAHAQQGMHGYFLTGVQHYKHDCLLYKKMVSPPGKLLTFAQTEKNVSILSAVLAQIDHREFKMSQIRKSGKFCFISKLLFDRSLQSTVATWDEKFDDFAEMKTRIICLFLIFGESDREAEIFFTVSRKTHWFSDITLTIWLLPAAPSRNRSKWQQKNSYSSDSPTGKIQKKVIWQKFSFVEELQDCVSVVEHVHCATEQCWWSSVAVMMFCSLGTEKALQISQNIWRTNKSIKDDLQLTR